MSNQEAEQSDDGAIEGNPLSSVAVLDQSLWAQFHRAETPEGFLQAWLGLQCRHVPGALTATVVIGEPNAGPFTPAALWPPNQEVHASLTAAADECIAKRQSIVMALHGQGGQSTVAVPIEIDGDLYGTVALGLEGAGAEAAQAVRQLHWGMGWLEALLRREQSATDAALRDRTTQALNVLSVVLEHKRFQPAASALVTELAIKLNCDQVAIGFLRGKRTKVAALSHTSGFGKRMNLVRDIGLAMDEALDQNDLVLYPPNPGWDYRVTRMHEDLVTSHRAGAILTVPLQTKEKLIGALTFERGREDRFDDETVELCDVIASMVASVIAEKRKNDRMLVTKTFEVLGNQLRALLGPRYIGRKIATLVMGGLVYLALTVTSEFTIVADARLEGSVQRTVVVPFDGYIQSETVRAGAKVSSGEILATLDSSDFELERLRWSTVRSQRQIEFDRALAERERAQANIIRSQIAQAEAQLALIDAQLERTRISAPFDGIVVSGDLSQSIGSAVMRGDELFKIAPLDAFRVALNVDESDIAELVPGQEGQLRVAARPTVPLTFQVERITPVARQAEGRNFFRVEASLSNLPDWVRPNMEGVGRVSVDERLVVTIWTRRLVNWFRLAIWRFRP